MNLHFLRELPELTTSPKDLLVYGFSLTVMEIAYVPKDDIVSAIVGGLVIYLLVASFWWSIMYAGPLAFVFLGKRHRRIERQEYHLQDLLRVRKENRRVHGRTLNTNLFFAGVGFAGFIDSTLTANVIFAAYAILALAQYTEEDYKLYQFYVDSQGDRRLESAFLST